MKKIAPTFVIDQYRSGVESYTKFTKEVGLWESEKYVFQKHLSPDQQILDLGCGTGRTTFPLYQLGFQKIIGVDLTPEMIEQANALNTHFETQIEFKVGDAAQLAFDDEQFDAVIFSFNGIMSIPSQTKRAAAFAEIARVLKPNGTFIFTTHDRDKEPQFLDFWKAEKERWNTGQQNPKLYEYGDLITTSKNESREIFIHIPNQQEVMDSLQKAGFQLVETFYRNDQFNESKAVKVKSGECRFWIIKKSL